MYPTNLSSDSESHLSNNMWNICGQKSSRSAIVFFAQIIILYISILTCFVNLTVGNGPNELWITILSLSLGSILPSPKVKKRNMQLADLSFQHRLGKNTDEEEGYNRETNV